MNNKTLISVATFSALAGIVVAKPSADRPLSESNSIQALTSSSSNWQWGKQLFWDKADTSKFAQERRFADGSLRAGLAPLIGAVSWAGSNRWGDTTIDTAEAFQHRDPAWVAYTYWTYAHDSLTPKRPDGSYVAVPGSKDDYGWISAAMPMYPEDCPNGMANCTWGDWASERVARLCAATHQVGLAAADFVDGFPGSIANQIDFHPRVMKAFADTLKITIPGNTDAEKSTYIMRNLMPQWVDFWDDAWAHFYSETGRKIKLYSGREPLITAQCAWNVTFRRWMGVDFRRYYRKMPNPDSWYFGIEVQGDYMRALNSMGTTIATFGTYAAWEPSIPLGAKMNLIDDNFRQCLQFSKIPLRDTASLYNSQWFLVGFAHVANRDGSLRRGVQAFQYGYQDIPSSGRPAVTAAIHKHIPRRAYGPAFYFSDSIIRNFEARGKIWAIADDGDSAWNHAPHGYYVSDAAIDKLKPSAVPSSWIVTQPAILPAAERAKLERFAPVTSPDEAYRLSPIQAAGKARAWGFVDQDSSLVVVATNMDTIDIEATITVKGLPPGKLALHDGLTDSLVQTLPEEGIDTRKFTVRLSARDTRPLYVKSAFALGTTQARPAPKSAAFALVPTVLDVGGKPRIGFPRSLRGDRVEWVDVKGKTLNLP
ncbi:MAG TPA: hypothetical protein PKO15_16515 [Fibrobacteria bacterium]|nr:hypothetical protein [Fibrobacteria bacterium]